MIPALLSHVKSMLKGTTLNQAAPAWILALFQHKLSYQKPEKFAFSLNEYVFQACHHSI